MDENKYDIIHCHTPMGGVLTRLAARKPDGKGVKGRLYSTWISFLERITVYELVALLSD